MFLLQASTDVSGNTQTLTLDIPKAKITTEMDKSFKCSANVNSEFVVEASGTAGILAYLKQPAVSKVVLSMAHEIDCTIAGNSEVGAAQWYRESRDTATTPSSYNLTAYGDPTATVADTDFNHKISFPSITLADEGFYRCNITYNKTDTFPGGSIISEIGSITVITPGEANWCVNIHCDFGGVNCTGAFYDITNPVKPCTYAMSTVSVE